MEQIVSHSEEETISAGEKIAGMLAPGSVVALYGDLGSGKTRFTKGISRGLGIPETVTSPTFTIIHEHRSGRLPLYHFDFYRLRSPAELDEFGFEEYLYGTGVCVIEWADLIKERLPERRLEIFISSGSNARERIITISSTGAK